MSNHTRPGTTRLDPWVDRVRGITHELAGAARAATDMKSRLRLLADIMLFRALRVWPALGAHAKTRRVLLRGAPLSYRLNRGDIQGIREVWLDEIYRIPAPHPFRIVVDLGTNIGLTSVWLHRQYGLEMVLGVEPDLENLELARHNLEANDVRGRVIHAAVGPTDDIVRFACTQGASNLGHVSAVGVAVRQISMATVLAELPAERRIDLLKLDIEGAEEALLLADDLDWLDRIDSIIAEFHPATVNIPRLVAVLEQHGFTYFPAGTLWHGSMESSARLTGVNRKPERLKGSTRIVLIANEVGGLGGMEHQLEQLVGGLIDAGGAVTVIARRCDIPPRDRLRFVRVRSPGRPFTIAYPAFFVIASVLASRHRGHILHTTGAIVANRAEVSTVHYCHHGSKDVVSGSRSSRSSPSYRLNSRIAGILSRAGERWCYRPHRTRLLCAVSNGLQAELTAMFPQMSGRVQTVPNGVDVRVFRRDPPARERVRRRLNLDAKTNVALFVGDDWDRKGLFFALGALAEAPGWHLIVAGEGDADGLRQRAVQDGLLERLHLLGPVADVAPLYAAADVFVLPSAYETFSLVTYEAAASALPLLVARVSGVEDLLVDGENGWFVERDAADIAARLTTLARDPALMERMARRAREASRSFSWAAMVAGYMAVYHDITKVDR
jgi:FkbM family methyltransferase